MNACYKGMNSRRHTARFAMCIMAFAASVIAAQAQTPPYAVFQYSTLTASGDTITATQVPVVTTTGTTYVNVVLEFAVAADGTLTIASGYPQIVNSPRPNTKNFLAGSYTGPSADAEFYLTVAGPGVTAGGATEWSLTTASGASCDTKPNTATWYVFNGPMTQHPLAARLTAAGITTATYNAYSWGTSGDQNCGAGTNWGTNSLIGLSQTANALMILSFTQSGVDKSQNVDEITYTKNK